MRQLPGRQTPRWIRFLATTATVTVATVWLVSLLPFLLLLSILFGIALIPVLRRLGQEMDQVGISHDVKRPAVDVTPWHRQISLMVAQLRNRSSAMRR